MIPPPASDKPQLNPREVLQQEGVNGVAERLASTGYLIQRELLSDYVQVLRSGKIWMIEGEPGSGKSAVALATQFGFNMTMFPIQGMSELKLSDLLYEWDREAQNQSVIQAVTSGAKPLDEAQAEQYGRKFLKLGRALHAFHWAGVTAQVPLLFFDEVDKLPEHLQDMLLGLLECGYAYVPDYNQPVGIYDTERGSANRRLFPLAIFTSNNLRFKLSPPFRSRCFYSWLDKPTPEEEVKILRPRVPDASPEQVRAVVRINESIKAIPGVQNVGAIYFLPLTRLQASIPFTVADRPPPSREETPHAAYRMVTPGYLATLRIPLLGGRDFTEEDDAGRPPVALISAPLARKFFDDRSPLGQRLLLDDTDAPARPVEIVGVVGGVKQDRLESPPGFDIYLPLRQMTADNVPFLRNNSFWVLRTSTPPLSLEAAVRREIRSVDPNVPTSSVRTMEQILAGALAARRFSLILIGLFALSALLLAAAGLYAVITYGIDQRTREIGLRLALGATRPRILAMILGEGFRLVVGGVALGGVVTLALLKLIAAQLYGVSAYDPLSFAVVTFLLIGVGLLACGMAARRAARLDPAIALRAE